MRVKFVKRFLQKMPKGHDGQNKTERYEGIACTKANDHQRTGDQLDKRYRDAHRPQRPDRQECVRVRQKIFAGVFEPANLKNLEYTGHEEDRPQDEARQQYRPTSTYAIA